VSKSPDAFRTIREVAEELDLPQHVLRFWETRFVQIRPMKRGGGRRYYRPDDVDLLRGIRILLYGEGYTIRGVQRILKEHGPRFVIGAGRGEFAGLPDLRDATDEEDVGGYELPEPVAPEPVRPVAVRAAAVPEASIVPPVPRMAEPRPVPARSGLAAEDADRLKATLADLLDCKRLLDQVR
jgi:DNA-binding transcriptional MerR regulator